MLPHNYFPGSTPTAAPQTISPGPSEPPHSAAHPVGFTPQNHMGMAPPNYYPAPPHNNGISPHQLHQLQQNAAVLAQQHQLFLNQQPATSQHQQHVHAMYQHRLLQQYNNNNQQQQPLASPIHLNQFMSSSPIPNPSVLNQNPPHHPPHQQFMHQQQQRIFAVNPNNPNIAQQQIPHQQRLRSGPLINPFDTQQHVHPNLNQAALTPASAPSADVTATKSSNTPESANADQILQSSIKSPRPPPTDSEHASASNGTRSPGLTVDQIRQFLSSQVVADLPMPGSADTARKNVHICSQRLMALVQANRVPLPLAKIMLSVYQRIQVEGFQQQSGTAPYPPANAASSPSANPMPHHPQFYAPQQSSLLSPTNQEHLLHPSFQAQAGNPNYPSSLSTGSPHSTGVPSSTIPPIPSPSEVSGSRRKRSLTSVSSTNNPSSKPAGSSDTSLPASKKPRKRKQRHITPLDSNQHQQPASSQSQTGADPASHPPTPQNERHPYDQLPDSYKSVITFNEMRAYVGREKAFERASTLDKHQSSSILDQSRTKIIHSIAYEKEMLAQHGSRLGPLPIMYRNNFHFGAQDYLRVVLPVDRPHEMAKRGWFPMRHFDFSSETYIKAYSCSHTTEPAGRSGQPGSEIEVRNAIASDELVAIRVDIESDGMRYRDTFTWSINSDPLGGVTPELFAEATIADLNLPSTFAKLIAQAISQQVDEYITWRLTCSSLTHFSAHAPSNNDPLSHPSTASASLLVTNSVPNTTSELVRLQQSSTTARLVKIINSKDPNYTQESSSNWLNSTSSIELSKGPVIPSVIGGWLAPKMEDLRFIVKLHVAMHHLALVDTFEWDLLGPKNSAEHFARLYCKELGLDGEYCTAIAHSIREQAQWHLRSLTMAGYPFDNSAIASISPDLAQHFLIPLEPAMIKRPETIIGHYTPMFLEMTDEEAEKAGRGLDRDSRRKRRTGRKLPRNGSALGTLGAGVMDHGEPLPTMRSHFPIETIMAARMPLPVPVVHNHVQDILAQIVVTLALKNEQLMNNSTLSEGGNVGAESLDQDESMQARGGDDMRIKTEPSPTIEAGKIDCTIVHGLPVILESELNVPKLTHVPGRVPTIRFRILPDLYNSECRVSGSAGNQVRWWCSNCFCGDISTPIRRRGPGGTWVCNHCGLYYLTYNENPLPSPYRLSTRPKSMNIPQLMLYNSQQLPTNNTQRTQIAQLLTYNTADLTTDGMAHLRNPLGNGRGIRAPPENVPEWAPDWMHMRWYETMAKHPMTSFKVVQQGKGSAFRIACGDCAGKTYAVGPGMSYVNFEVHLKTAQHQDRAASRAAGLDAAHHAPQYAADQSFGSSSDIHPSVSPVWSAPKKGGASFKPSRAQVIEDDDQDDEHDGTDELSWSSSNYGLMQPVTQPSSTKPTIRIRVVDEHTDAGGVEANSSHSSVPSGSSTDNRPSHSPRQIQGQYPPKTRREEEGQADMYSSSSPSINSGNKRWSDERDAADVWNMLDTGESESSGSTSDY